MKAIKLISREELNSLANSEIIGLLTNNNPHIVEKLQNDDYHGSDDFYKIEVRSLDDLLITILRMKISMILSLPVPVVSYTMKDDGLYVTTLDRTKGKDATVEWQASALFQALCPGLSIIEERLIKLAANAKGDPTFSLNASIPKPQ